jgi:glycosyltransferase involved in cell wall biosynthesis
MYDHPQQVLEKYVPAAAFKGFRKAKTAFVLQSIKAGKGAALVVLSHVNLLSVGYAIKKLSPTTKVVLLAHGIEVWQPLLPWKRKMLQALDLVLPVSRFTSKKMKALFNLPDEKLAVVNNCLDPFLPAGEFGGKSPRLLQKFGLSPEHRIMLTLTRLSFKDRYKGYDDVLMVLKTLQKEDPLLKYMLVGGYTREEKARLERFIAQQGLTDHVIFAGFVPDEELAGYFSLADLYIMPSRKEGFGIVFIEALYYGLPVIAGNVDGSVDALAGGQLGTLLNPDAKEELLQAVRHHLRSGKNTVPSRTEVVQRFGFPVYKKALEDALLPLLTAPGAAVKKGATLAGITIPS